jgi:hypothetical protein
MGGSVMFRIYKRLIDVFSKGDLIRITETGETFIYESSTGGANYSSYLKINVRGQVFEYSRSLHVDDVVKVDINGDIIDDFSSLTRK